MKCTTSKQELIAEIATKEADGNRRQLQFFAANIPDEGTVECTNESTGKVYHWANNELRHKVMGLQELARESEIP